MKPIKKQVVWCQEQIPKGAKFFNVIWMDECSVQLDNHGRLCFKRKKEKCKLKPPKTPTKATCLGRYISPRCHSNSYLQRYLNLHDTVKSCRKVFHSLWMFFQLGTTFRWTMIQSIAANTRRKALVKKSTGGKHLWKAQT